MVEYIVELPGHDNGVTRELVENGCFSVLATVIVDGQQGAAAVGKRSDGITAVVRC